MSAWFRVAEAWDDDTLAALGNVGLLRRAARDVESGKVDWRERASDHAILTVDGQVVRIDGRGPREARCDCPAPGLCRHVLAAAVWLRQRAADGDAASTETADTPADAPVASSAPTVPTAPTAPTAATDATAAVATGPASTTPEGVPTGDSSDARAEVLGLDPARLLRAAGKAGTRQAAAWFAAAVVTPAPDDGAVRIEPRGRNLLVSAAALPATCRYVAGGGFDGMVSELPASRQSAAHLAAIALIWREAGRPFPWPPDVDVPDTLAAPQATADNVPRVPGRSLTDDERHFVGAVRDALRALVSGGLSHVSDVTAQRLRAMNVSARSEGLPRLAGLLRELSGTIERLHARSHLADERQALQVIARTHALCLAMLAATESVPRAMIGQVRREYTVAADRTLIALGARWWVTRGGARGLTTTFWDTATGELLQATAARPDATDISFDRQGAWASHSLWPGAGSPQAVLTAGAVHVVKPRLADAQRLGIGGETRASAQPAPAVDDPIWAQMGCADWRIVANQLRADIGLCAEPQEVLLLRPARLDKPRLDEIRQTLDWPVADAAGRWLTLQLRGEDLLRQRIEWIDDCQGNFDRVRAVLVRIDRSDPVPVLEPFSLLVADGPAMRVVALDFTQRVRRTLAGSLTGRILRMLEIRKAAPIVFTPQGIGYRIAAPVLGVLEAQAATGRPMLGESARVTLAGQAALARTVGLDRFATAIERYVAQADPARNLTLVHLASMLVALDGIGEATGATPAA